MFWLAIVLLLWLIVSWRAFAVFMEAYDRRTRAMTTPEQKTIDEFAAEVRRLKSSLQSEVDSQKGK